VPVAPERGGLHEVLGMAAVPGQQHGQPQQPRLLPGHEVLELLAALEPHTVLRPLVTAPCTRWGAQRTHSRR